MSTILEICSDLPTRSFSKGETILKQGSKDDEILFMKSGTVEIQVDGSAVTTVTNAGAMLGEVGVLLDHGHSASAIALKDSEFFVLESAEKSLSGHPEISREISRALARRLVRASESVADLTKQVEIDQDLGDFELMMLWDEDNNEY